MSNNCVFSPLFLEQVQLITPWARFLGAPGLPETPLYRPDSSFGASDKVEVSYDTKGLLKSLKATSGNDVATIDFDFFTEDDIKKLSCTLKKNSTIELTLVEYFDTDTGYLTVKRPNYSSYNVDISVEAVDGGTEEFDTTILFNNKTFNEIIPAGALDVPKIVVDFASAISSMGSNLTVAAFETNLAGILTAESFKLSNEIQYRTIVAHLINWIIAGIVGGFFVPAGLLVGVISELLICDDLF